MTERKIRRMRALEHSNENTQELRSFKRSLLLAILTMIVLIIGVSIAVAVATTEKRVMAPGPIGSTESVSKPLA